MKFYNKYVDKSLFVFLFLAFTSAYFSFFPGVYSFDSYFSYSQSLNLLPYQAVNVPIFTVFWKIFNNENYGPFVSNYIILSIAFLLFYIKNKNFIVNNFVLLFLLVPSSLITYVWVWKDNALVSLLFLSIGVLNFVDSKDSYKRNIILGCILFVLFFACSIRINAVFAVFPLFIYLFNRIMKTKVVVFICSLSILFLFVALNGVINDKIYNAQKINFSQTLMYTDIVKLNYYYKLDIQLPEEFKTSYYNTSNINQIMDKYYNFSCNDILFMNIKSINNEHPVVNSSRSESAISALRIVWVEAIFNHPVDYLMVRVSQLNNALWANNIFAIEPFDKSSLYDKLIDENKIHNSLNNKFTNIIRQLYNQSSARVLFSSAGFWFYAEILLMTLVIFCRKKIKNYQLVLSVFISGLFYTLGYIPILPCTDYRYFLWTICSTWLGGGILIVSIIKDDVKNNVKS